MDDKQLGKFLPYLEHATVSEERKMQILRDLWKIMESFADEAWDVCPPPDRKKPDRNSN